MAVKIDNVQRKFLSYIVPDIAYETDDLNNVALVFERINRAGTELNTFELLSAWSWSDSFDLVENLKNFKMKLLVMVLKTWETIEIYC